MSHAADHRLTPNSHWSFARPVSGVCHDTGPGISFGLLILFLIVLYSNISKMYPQLETVRPALIVAAGAVLAMFVELGAARRGFKLTWPQGYLLPVFIGVAVISSFSAIYSRHAFETTLDIAKILLVYLLLENTVTSETRVRMILWTLVLGGLFPAVGTIRNFMRGILWEQTRAAWIGIFRNPNESAYALVLLVPLAGALFAGSHWIARIGLAAIVTAYLIAIYLTFSRGGVIGLLAVLGLLGWKQKSVLVRAFMVVALAAGLLVMALFWQRKDDFKDLRRDTTVNQRIATMKAGIAMFVDRPLTGVGPGCSMVAYPLYVPKEAHCGCQDQLVIHNAFIQVLSEMGLLGFLPFIVFLGLTIYQLRIASQRAGTAPIAQYTAGLEVALWGFVVCGMSGGFSYTWFPYILVGLSVATKRVADWGLQES